MGTILAGAATDRGRVREQNQDAVRLAELDSPQVAATGYLAVVADGMGGYQRGEIASSIAVEALFAAFYADPQEDGVAAALRRGFKAANDRIVAQSGGGGDAPEMMGTTMVAAVLLADQLTVANVGDSRAYLLRAEAATQITRDHSLVAEQLASGALSPEQARGSRYRNVVTRALGQGARIEVDVFEISLLPDDRVVLCSDGVHGVVEPDELAELGLRDTPERASRALIERAIERESTDNVSAVVLWYEPAAAAPAGAAPGREPVGAGAGGRSPILILLVLLVLIAVIAIVAVAFGAFG
jgi:protein phosphatase